LRAAAAQQQQLLLLLRNAAVLLQPLPQRQCRLTLLSCCCSPYGQGDEPQHSHNWQQDMANEGQQQVEHEQQRQPAQNEGPMQNSPLFVIEQLIVTLIPSCDNKDEQSASGRDNLQNSDSPEREGEGEALKRVAYPT
jgi:hypothetical protein